MMNKKSELPKYGGMEDAMIKAGIIGATGYAGQELVRLLLQHKEVEIVWYGSRSYVDKKFSSVFGNVFQIVENICKSDLPQHRRGIWRVFWMTKSFPRQR